MSTYLFTDKKGNSLGFQRFKDVSVISERPNDAEIAQFPAAKALVYRRELETRLKKTVIAWCLMGGDNPRVRPSTSNAASWKSVLWFLVVLMLAVPAVAFLAFAFYIFVMPHGARANEMHYTAVIKEGAYLSPQEFCKTV